MEITSDNSNEFLKNSLKKYAEYSKSKEHGEKEGYKWEFINKHKGVFDNFDDLSKKMDSLGSQNFFPHIWKTSVFRFLSQNHEKEFKEALGILFNEDLSLDERIVGFIEKLNPLLEKDSQWKSKAYKIDVDSAPFFLFLKDPKRYFLYPVVKPFEKFGKLLYLQERHPDLFDSRRKVWRYIAWQKYCEEEVLPTLDDVLGRKADLLDAEDAMYCRSRYFTEGYEIPKNSKRNKHSLISKEEEAERLKKLREQGIKI